MNPLRLSVVGRQLLPVVLISTALVCHGADEFYRRFSQDFSTNGIGLGVRYRDPALVDTNNNTLKLTNTLLLNDLLNGQVGRIHLGMSMDEVVAEWGKPKWLYGQCSHGHRLAYSDCTLAFRSNCLCWIGLRPLSFGLSIYVAKTQLQSWTNQFRMPDRLETNGWRISAAYETRGKRHTAFVLHFDNRDGAQQNAELYLDPIFDSTNGYVKSAWEQISISNCISTAGEQRH